MDLRVCALFTVLALTACGPTDLPCGPTTCGGCCDATGACVGGALPTACGSLGNSCDVCVGNQQCAGRCISLLTPTDAGCMAETDTELCRGAVCGDMQVVDRCGAQRQVSCGSCATTHTCQAGQCTCQPETDAQLCGQTTCGPKSVIDRCGTRRQLTCGTCGAAQACNAAGQCVCQPEPDSQLCGQTTCGSKAVIDRCGASRQVMCGNCSSTQACGTSGQCVCQPESDAQLCTAAGRSCGVSTLTDRCGRARTVSCGTCTGAATCSAAGVCSCTRETDIAFCARNTRSCGSVTALDNCGATRTVASCGTCTSPNTCTAGTCSCQAETNTQFCVRMGASCGTVTGNDLCGQQRSVSCGTCSGSLTCGGSGRANVCGCAAEDNPTFCARVGKNCGTPSAYDNCGTWRSGVPCGSCAGTQTCGGGGVSNVCGCAAETNSAFLARLGKDCGTVTAPDNCGVTRSVFASSYCYGTGATCGGGGVTNVCGCTPQTDAQLCTAGAATCGALSATDRCGAYRMVSSCGTCTAPQSCGGGTTARTCGCTPETNAAFCSRNSATCGAVTGTDNCGGARTVASCGTCAANSVCGLSQPNTCGAYTETFEPMCNPDGWCFDHPLPFAARLTDVAATSASEVWFVGSNFTWAQWDGVKWAGGFDVRRGNLSGLWVSGAEVWAVGDGATVVRRVGAAWVDVAKPTGMTNLTAIHGFSATDVWVGGASAVSHWDGATWTRYAVPGVVTSLWGGATNDVWAVGNGFISRWNGTTWVTQPSMSWSFSDVAGSSVNDVWAVATGHVMHFNGVYWADMLNDSCSSVWVGGPAQVTIACTASGATSSVLKQWDGTMWTTVPTISNPGGARLLAGGGDRLLAAVTTVGTVERFVSGQWVIVAPTQLLTTSAFKSVQTFANGDALALDSTTVFKRTLNTWRANASTSYAAHSLYGFSANDFLVGSQDGSSHTRPIAYRVTNGLSTAQNLPNFYPSTWALSYPRLDSIWAASPTDVHAVGQTYRYDSYYSATLRHGTFHSDGSTWTSPLTHTTNDSATSSDVFRVHGSSAASVWAIDRGRSVWKLVGGAWARVTTGSPLTYTDALTGLWVQSDTKTWLGGTFGVVDFDAATGYGVKRAVPTPTLSPLPSGTYPHTVRGLTSSPTLGLHALGTSGGRGVAWSWTGTAWVVQSLLPMPINAVDVSGNELVAAGDSGHIYRRVR
jgi:hypothetical protein